jgi:hypothetical protein
MNMQRSTLVMIPEEELTALKNMQQEILRQLKNLHTSHSKSVLVKHVTAKEFMEAVRVCRSKFDQLVAQSKIKTIKKRRKIYVPIEEVERYFSDSSIL